MTCRQTNGPGVMRPRPGVVRMTPAAGASGLVIVSSLDIRPICLEGCCRIGSKPLFGCPG
jgi:hypothetical protein